MYTIEPDPHRKRIFVKLTGFFSLEEVEAFAVAQKSAVRSLNCPSGEYVVLVDAPSNIIQSQDVVTAFQNVIADAPIKARRIAVVAQGSLYKMQTRRILLSERSALFETMDEAEAWLAEGAHPA